MIHNIWILSKESGILIFHEKFGTLETQEDLISGFLSAMYSFIELEIGKGIESVEIDAYTMVYCHSHGLLFVLVADKEDSVSTLKAQINLIKDSFLDEFPALTEGWESFQRKAEWNGNFNIFCRFQTPLKDLIKSWVDVEVTTSAADKMDLVEVYQQVFSRISKISISLLKRGRLKRELEEKVEATISHYQSVLNVNDLSSIYDGKESFLNVLSVNVLNPDLSVATVKSALHELCTNILEVLREQLGDKKFNEDFRKNVTPYLKSDWNRIRALGIDQAFITYLP